MIATPSVPAGKTNYLNAAVFGLPGTLQVAVVQGSFLEWQSWQTRIPTLDT